MEYLVPMCWSRGSVIREALLCNIAVGEDMQKVKVVPAEEKC